MDEKAENPAKIGRPLKPINWQTVAEMAGILCTHEEIANCNRVGLQTLHDRCLADNGESFRDFYNRHADGGRESLRRAQYKSALGGSATMLKWLGSNWLGQSERQETVSTVHVSGFEVLPEQDSQE